MNTNAAKTLAEIFQCDEISFDEAGCATHTLPSNQTVHMRWLEEDSALLMALPLGKLNGELAEVRSFMLLIGNRSPHLTGGGAFGWDRETGDVYLSRIFPIGPNVPNLAEALGAVMPFCTAGEAARYYFGTVNEAQLSEQMDEFTFPGVPVAEVEAIADEIQAETDEEQPPSNDEYLAQYSTFLGEAIESLGMEYGGLDEELALSITGDDPDVMTLIRFDVAMGEIVLTAALGAFDDDAILEVAPDLLADNLYVEATGNCTLGISDGDPAGAFLTLVVTMEGLLPESANFANLIGGFLQNAAVWCESLRERTTGGGTPPPPSASGMPSFV